MSTQIKQLSRTGRSSDKRCPKCGSTLLTNDYGQLWCSLIPSGSKKCVYGMEHESNCALVGDPALWCMPHTCDCGYEEAHRDKLTFADMMRDVLEKQIDAFWKFLEQGFEIEPRSYFEEQIQKGIGFCDSPMVMALHHVWKRKPQVALLAQRIAELESANRLAINRFIAIKHGQGTPEDTAIVVQALKKALWFEGRAGNEGNDSADS